MIGNRRLVSGASLVVAAAFVLLSGPAAVAANGSSDGYTADQLAKVENALVDAGATPSQIEKILGDPVLIETVPVDFTVTSSASSPVASGLFRVEDATLAPMSVGSSCTGSSGYRAVTVYLRSLAGNALGSYKMTTRFCYNGSQVTYAYSQYVGNITTSGSIGGLEYNGVQSSSEGFGIYNGHSNGKVDSYSQAKFTENILWIGVRSVYPSISTSVRYNGTSTYSYTCTGCTF